eukprot:12829470-Alexandrium_andersonii.AAC.1
MSRHEGSKGVVGSSLSAMHVRWHASQATCILRPMSLAARVNVTKRPHANSATLVNPNGRMMGAPA